MRRRCLRLLFAVAVALPAAMLSAAGSAGRPAPAAVVAPASPPAVVAPLPVPEQTGRVVDQTGRLDGDFKASLSARLAAMQAADRAQVAILVAKDIGGEPLAAYSLRVAERWQLGRAGRDDGLLIVVVPATNAARIEVGYGLEGVIPDALASRWVDELLPTLAAGDLAGGLGVLVDSIDGALPMADQGKPADATIDPFAGHPEWRLPFVLVLFSLFAVVPLFVGRSGALASAPLLATFYGLAAWSLWDSPVAGGVAAVLAFPWPLLWRLNGRDAAELSPWLRRARGLANGVGILLFFAILTLFVGLGLHAGGVAELWAAPIFGSVMALGLVPFLFPGRTAQRAQVVLRSYLHFIFALTIFRFALDSLVAAPTPPALALAAAFTACIAGSLWLDARARGRSRASPWLIGVALLIFLPCAALLLAASLAAASPATLLAQVAAGGGSFAGVLWWAARHGFFAALKIGLGGRFGGGGAGHGG